jgi:hypothetical protein
MAFTWPIVHPVAAPRSSVVDLGLDRDVPGTRFRPAGWGRALLGVGLLLFLVWASVERSVAADRVRRAEVEAREGHLYRQLSNRDAILESQRRIYLERIRRLELQLWAKDQEISALRARTVP